MVTYARPVFEAIADPTRRAILDLLRAEEMPAGEVARRFPVSRPAISRHLRVLRAAGLVRERREAQQRLYSLAPEPLRELDRWLDGYRVFWSARLQDLKRVVEAEQRGRQPRRDKNSGPSPRSGR
jgi:DNA-binding transcriptional ArsR family regulator